MERLSKQREPLTTACFKALECEKGDTFEEVFERRIAIQQYFNYLKRNMVRIQTMKDMAAQAAEAKAKPAKKQVQASVKKAAGAQAGASGPKGKKKPVPKKGQAPAAKGRK